MHERRAFTLVELLVVIAIIGSISTIAIVSLGASRLQSRNARRIADIAQLTRVLYLALDANGSYPDSSASNSGFACVSATCTGGWAVHLQNATVNSAISPYLANKPVDPTGDARGYSGYLFNNNWDGGIAPYDDSVFTAGPYLDYMLENAPGVSCGQGKIYSKSTTATECMFLINQ